MNLLKLRFLFNKKLQLSNFLQTSSNPEIHSAADLSQPKHSYIWVAKPLRIVTQEIKNYGTQQQ